MEDHQSHLQAFLQAREFVNLNNISYLSLSDSSDSEDEDEYLPVKKGNQHLDKLGKGSAKRHPKPVFTGINKYNEYIYFKERDSAFSRSEGHIQISKEQQSESSHNIINKGGSSTSVQRFSQQSINPFLEAKNFIKQKLWMSGYFQYNVEPDIHLLAC